LVPPSAYRRRPATQPLRCRHAQGADPCVVYLFDLDTDPVVFDCIAPVGDAAEAAVDEPRDRLELLALGDRHVEFLVEFVGVDVAADARDPLVEHLDRGALRPLQYLADEVDYPREEVEADDWRVHHVLGDHRLDAVVRQ
jgi:hypothetical protein